MEYRGGNLYCSKWSSAGGNSYGRWWCSVAGNSQGSGWSSAGGFCKVTGGPHLECCRMKREADLEGGNVMGRIFMANS